MEDGVISSDEEFSGTQKKRIREDQTSDTDQEQNKKSKTEENNAEPGTSMMTSTQKWEWEHFTNVSETTIKCNICGVTIRKTRYNARRHLQNKHKEVTTVSEKKHQPLLRKKEKQKQNKFIKVRMSKEILIRACIGFVTEDFKPFSFLDSKNVRSLIDPLVDGLVASDGGKRFRINARNIRNLVKKTAFEIRSNLKNEMKSQLISLKIDGASRQLRTVFGISAQYTKDREVKSHILAMLELSGSHPSTAENLSKQIKCILKRYDVHFI
jgi:hypothetical protein